MSIHKPWSEIQPEIQGYHLLAAIMLQHKCPPGLQSLKLLLRAQLVPAQEV